MEVRGSSNVLLARLGGRSSAPIARELEGSVWWSRSFEWLAWSHHAALRVLQGELVTQIFSPCFYLLAGHHRPVWSPCPGADDVIVAFMPDPPIELVGAPLMVMLAERMRAGT